MTHILQWAIMRVVPGRPNMITNPGEFMYGQDLEVACSFWDGSVWRVMNAQLRPILRRVTGTA